MRIAVGKIRVEAAHRQQLAHPIGAAARVLLDAVHHHRLADDRADLLARIERAVRVLEDDLDAAAQGDQFAAVEPGDIDAVIEDFTGGRLFETQDTAAHRRFAAAALADKSEGLAALDRQIDAVDRLHVTDMAARDHSLGDREVHPQPPHLQKRLRLGARDRHAAPAVMSSSWLRKQAESWPGVPAGAKGGLASAHFSIAKRQRGRNEQPRSSRVKSGGCPSIGSRRACRGRSSRGTERNSAIV